VRRQLAILIPCLTLLATALWFTLWPRTDPSPTATGQPPPFDLVTTLTNAYDGVKSRVTGGIGVLLSVPTGEVEPMVAAVIEGSPAARSGLLAGDRLLAVDGVTTSNRPMADVAAQIRGFRGGRVTFLIERRGKGPLEYVVERVSWNEMEEIRRRESIN
jgi:membrane-associated protease RseP (regulator of RpoE activity)